MTVYAFRKMWNSPSAECLSVVTLHAFIASSQAFRTLAVSEASPASIRCCLDTIYEALTAVCSIEAYFCFLVIYLQLVSSGVSLTFSMLL